MCLYGENLAVPRESPLGSLFSSSPLSTGVGGKSPAKDLLLVPWDPICLLTPAEVGGLELELC